MAYYLKQESQKGESANWIVRDFQQIDGDILKSSTQDPDIIYHFACVSDSDMNVKREDQFPWPLTIEFFERAYEPLDWKYQVYVKSRKEFKVFKFKGVSEAALVEHMSKVIGKPVYEDDMRAWRFWATYLGLGNLHDMLLLPNMYTYLKAVLTVCNLKKNEEYTFTDFVAAIKPYAEIGLSDIDGNKKINLAMSSGLRALHDEGIIQLSHKLDSGDMWFLYEAELHPIKSTVTHVTVRR